MRNLTLICLLVLAGCNREKAASPVTSDAPTPAEVAASDFTHLNYLQGDWRGTMPNGGYFYERYAIVDDSTMASYTMSDSTFATVADSGRIRWSRGQVRTGAEGGGYVATIWTADSVRFDPVGETPNAFVWVRTSPDAWTARLYPRTSGAVTTYSMTRVR